MNGTDEFGGISIDDTETDEFGGIPLPFEEEQKPLFPSLGPSSTLADVLAQPTPQLTPWEGGVVRSALPGILQPEDLLPAVRKIGGEVVTGEQGQTHPDIIKDYDIPAVEIDQRGFKGPLGFMDRESAAQALQAPTAFEPGRLHSTDLANLQETQDFKEGEQYGALKPSSLTTLQRLRRTEAGRKLLGPTTEERELGIVPGQDVGIVPLMLSAPLPFGPGPETAVGKAILGGFIAQFISQAPDAWKSFKDAVSRGDWSEAGKVAIETGFGAAFTALAGKGLHDQLRIEIGSKSKARTTIPEPIAEKPAASPEVSKVAPEAMKSTEDAQSAGLNSTSVSDLEALAKDRRDRMARKDVLMEQLKTATDPKVRDATFNELQQLRTQLPREAIETATNSGSAVEGESPTSPSSKLGPRPLDWRQNPEVAEWLKKNGAELGIKLPAELSEPTLAGKAPEGFTRKVTEPLPIEDIRKHLESEGIARDNKNVSIVEKPDSVELGRFDPSTGKIEINHSQIADINDLKWVWDHERAHKFDVENPGAVATLRKTITGPEWGKIQDEVIRAGYEASQHLRERDARVVTTLADAWRGRTYFNRLVKTVQNWAGKRGIEMDRVTAEKTAVRALAESTKALKENKWQPKVATIEEPLEGKREEEPIGMGGARAGEPAPGTQIEQLTQSLRNVRESRLPLREQIKESFNVGERLATAKDAIGKALSGMKAAGDTIIKKWQGVENIDDLLRAKQFLSASIEDRGWRLHLWEKEAFRAVPNPRDQAAIAKWVDSGGDTAALQQGLANAPAKFKRAYQDALNLSGDKLVAAQNVQNYFESRLQEAIDAGVLEHGIENYIHRMYESRPDLQQKALTYTQTGLLKTNPALAKRRVFQFDWEAEKEGYVPVQSFIRRITAYEAALSKAIAAREFIKKVSDLEAPDGRPIVDIKGVGIPIMDPAGVYKEATLVKPKFNPAKNTEEFLPNGDKNPNYRGDYASRDYRALQRWKWVGSDSGGKPIFVQGDVAIHPDFVTRVDALLKPSQVRYGPLGKIGRPLLNVGSAVKQTMLDLSGFHPVQVTVHGMEHKVMPWNIIKDINLDSPDIQGLLKGGMTLGGEYHGSYREGLVGSSLTRHVPFLGPLMESYHQWLFQDYIPRLKATMALGALKRNRARFSGTMSDEAIFQKTANQANAAFGELNYIVLERSKTAQDMSRLILLAPDFLEARGRFAIQAFEKGGKTKVPMFGNEQRAALLLGALTMYVTARIANKILDDQYHFEPENLFNIVYKDHAYGLRTVQGDILHFLNDPLKFWMSRLNPVYGRTLLEGLTGRDYFGRKRSIAEQAWDAVSTMIPITLRSNRERQLWESLLNGFGATARRWSEVDTAFQLAKKWKDKNGIPERGEFIYDPNKDPLRSLKLALNHGDEAGAAQEIKKVIASKVYTQKRLDQYFKRYATMPFAGSKANDLKFMKSLNADQRKTVEAARQHKFEIFKLYRKSRSQMSAPAEPSEPAARDEFGGIPLE